MNEEKKNNSQKRREGKKRRGSGKADGGTEKEDGLADNLVCLSTVSLSPSVYSALGHSLRTWPMDMVFGPLFAAIQVMTLPDPRYLLIIYSSTQLLSFIYNQPTDR